VWDTEARQELLELPRSGNWNFNVLWSPTNPGVFTTASFDGKASAPSVQSVSWVLVPAAAPPLLASAEQPVPLWTFPEVGSSTSCGRQACRML